MTSIIVLHEDLEPEQFDFNESKGTITLGRRSSNDVCIPDLSVSGNHAKITIENGKATLEDLNSTNGSYVKGRNIETYDLASGDEIILGNVLLSFKCDSVKTESQADSNNTSSGTSSAAQDNDADNFDADDTPDKYDFNSKAGNGADAAADTPHPLDGIEHLVVPQSSGSVTPMHEPTSINGVSERAAIQIKNGAKSGQVLPIDKPVTTLGRPGIQIAAIMRKPDGFFVMHIESADTADKPTLNSDEFGEEPKLLHSGDALKVAGIEVEFVLS